MIRRKIEAWLVGEKGGNRNESRKKVFFVPEFDWQAMHDGPLNCCVRMYVHCITSSTPFRALLHR